MSDSRSNKPDNDPSNPDLNRAQKFRTVPAGLSPAQIAELTGKFALEELYTKDLDGINAYKDNIPTFLTVYKVQLAAILNRHELAVLTRDLLPYQVLAEQTQPLFSAFDVEDNSISLAQEISKLLDKITLVRANNTIVLNDSFNQLNKYCLDASINFPSLNLMFNKIRTHALAKTNSEFAAALERITVSPGILIRPIQKFAHMNGTLEELIKRAKKIESIDNALIDRLEITRQLFQSAGQEMNHSRFLYELVNIINQIKKNIIQTQRVDPETNPLTRKLTALANNMIAAKKTDGSIDREKVTQLFMSFYVDSYLEYRTKNYLKKTKKPPFLRDLEICIVQQENLTRGGSAEGKLDKLIFKYINTISTLRSSVIKQLFTRATAEGLGSQQKQIYINAYKEAARLGGDDPIVIQQIKTEWDAIAAERGLNDPALQLPTSDLTENAISQRYEALRHQEQLINTIKVKLAPDIFISLLKNERPKDISGARIDELDALVQDLQTVNASPEQMHHLFMNTYGTYYFQQKIYLPHSATNDAALLYMEKALKESGITRLINNPEQRLTDLTEFVIATYADAYVDGRSKNIFGKTSKTDFLIQMEKNIFEVFHLTLEAGKTPEIIIMQLASTHPTGRKDIVNHLYSRAMAEGIGMRRRDVFINVTKLVVRMGSDAISDWNALSTEKLKDIAEADTVLIANHEANGTAKTYNERFLINLFDLIHKSRALLKAIKNIFTPQILLLLLNHEIRNAKLTQWQRKRIMQIFEALKKLPENQDPFRDTFISAYLEAYINERKHRVDGELLKALERSAAQLKKLTSNSFFSGNPIKPDHMDAEILSSVSGANILNHISKKKPWDDLSMTSSGSATVCC